MIISTLINLLLAVILAVAAIRKINAYWLIIVLFCYLTLHYSYAALYLLSFEPFYAFHERTQPGVKLIGLGFILFSLILLLSRFRQYLFSRQSITQNKSIIVALLGWVIAISVYWLSAYLHDGTFPGGTALQDVVSAGLLSVITIGLSTVLPWQQPLSERTMANLNRAALCILLIIVAIGFYEVVSLKAWAGSNIKESADRVFRERRASSLLFNPNVLGFWGAFLSMFASYSYAISPGIRKWAAAILVLAGWAVFLSGSRSGFILALCMLCLVPLLHFAAARRDFQKELLWPPIFFIGSIGSTAVLVELIDSLTDRMVDALHVLHFLAYRFISIPVVLGSYFWSPPTGQFEGNAYNTQQFVNIDGRLNPSALLPDNGFLAMYQDGGPMSLIFWIVFFGILVLQGTKVLFKEPKPESAYALSLVLGCAISAVFARTFQIFPFWVMIGLALGLALAWFKKVDGAVSSATGKPDL